MAGQASQMEDLDMSTRGHRQRVTINMVTVRLLWHERKISMWMARQLPTQASRRQ